MLKLVHEHINQLWEETDLSLEKIRQNIVEKNPEASISVSKLHRILSDPLCKLSLEDLLMLIQDGFKKDPNVLLAKIGGQEYEDSKDVGYKGAAALIADFERRETAIRAAFTEQLEKEKVLRANIHQAFNEAKDAFDRAVRTMTAEHEAALKHRDETYERAKNHLKEQLADDAKEYSEPNLKYGRCLLLCYLCWKALLTLFIIIFDASCKNDFIFKIHYAPVFYQKHLSIKNNF